MGPERELYLGSIKLGALGDIWGAGLWANPYPIIKQFFPGTILSAFGASGYHLLSQLEKDQKKFSH